MCRMVSLVQSGSPWSCINLLWVMVGASSTGTDGSNAVMLYTVIHYPDCNLKSLIDSLKFSMF